MRFLVYWAACTALLLFFSPASARHGPGVKVGDRPAVIAWCNTADEVRAALPHATDGIAKTYYDFIMNSGNSCSDSRIAQSFGIPMYPRPIEVLGIVEIVLFANRGFAIEIIHVKELSSGDIFYSWHVKRLLRV